MNVILQQPCGLHQGYATNSTLILSSGGVCFTNGPLVWMLIMPAFLVKALRAGFVAPLVALALAFVVVAVVAIARGQPEALVAAPAFGGLLLLFTYLIMFLFGIPIYLISRRMGWDSIWTAALVGFVAAYTVPFLLQLEIGRETASNGIKLNIAYANLNTLLANPLMALSWFDLFGVVVGIAFWWLVERDPLPIDAPVTQGQK